MNGANRNTGKIKSKTIVKDSIAFKSYLEASCYDMLKKADIEAEYEPLCFELQCTLSCSIPLKQ